MEDYIYNLKNNKTLRNKLNKKCPKTYEENYKTLLNDTKVSFNKWKDITCSCV